MRTYRARICKPDSKGYYRPEVGGKRFTVGHKATISEGEAQRRRDALQQLFERQNSVHQKGVWAEWVLPYAQQIASGQRIVLEVSDFARHNPGQASEEALMLEQLKSLGLAVSASDPQVITIGERWIQERIQAEVRRAVEHAVADTTARMGMTGDLADRVSGTIPDPSAAETRTFHDALKAFRQHVEKTGKKQEGGGLAPSPRNYIRWAKQLQSETPDFPLWELDRTKLEELIAHWRNRPVSKKLSQNISYDYSKHLLSGLWAVVKWLDQSPRWKWELPKGAEKISRTPVMLAQDRQKSRARRVSGQVYSVEQLALIARQLDPLGRLIIGVSVNCAMQPAECGRLDVGDYFSAHPETGATGEWIIFDRPKTSEYGEWVLWPEVAALVRWGVQRANRIGTPVLIVQENGQPWYRDDWGNPCAKFGKWWQANQSETDTHIGVVSKLARDNENFPRHTIKSLRKVLPNLLRPKFGKEIADLVNARRVDASGRSGGRETDRYADRLYDRVAEAIRDSEPHFRPFLDVLAETDLNKIS